MVGHKVELTISCPGATISNITWSVPGHYVKNYTADHNTAVLTFLDSTDLAQPTVAFFWVQPSAPFTWVVKVTFTRKKDGASTNCEKSISLVVKGPIVTTVWPTKIGISGGVAGKNAITMGFGDVLTEGIAFKASVVEPAGFTFGFWQFVQLTAPEIVRNTSPPGTCDLWKGTTNQSLDNGFPYPVGATGDTVGPWGANGTAHVSTDSPSVTLNTANYSQLNRDDSYIIYLMYQPDAAGSIWVAITYSIWSISYCANVAVNGDWNVVQQSNSVSAWPNYYPGNPHGISDFLKTEAGMLPSAPGYVSDSILDQWWCYDY